MRQFEGNGSNWLPNLSRLLCANKLALEETCLGANYEREGIEPARIEEAELMIGGDSRGAPPFRRVGDYPPTHCS